MMPLRLLALLLITPMIQPASGLQEATTGALQLGAIRQKRAATDCGLSGQATVQGAPPAVSLGADVRQRTLQQSGTEAGRVVGWGTIKIPNYVPSDVLQQGATGIAIIALGPQGARNGFLALLANQSVVAWGGASGNVSIPANATATVTAIAAGWTSAIALLTNGTVVPLNDISLTYQPVPQLVQTAVTAIWMAANTQCARLRNGSVVMWELVNGDISTNIIQPGAGSGAGLMITGVALDDSSGTVVTLRANGSVILEQGDSVIPRVLRSKVVAITSGATLDGSGPWLALLGNGSIVQWSDGSVLFPFNATNQNFTSIAAPAWAVTDSGSVVSWDVDSLNDTSSSIPLSVQDGVKSLVISFDMSLALKQPGPNNVLGFSGAILGPASESVPAGARAGIVTQVAAGRAHAIALQSDGRLVVWGDNSNGQFSVPEALGVVDVVQVAAAADYCAAVTQQGNLYVWGGQGSEDGQSPSLTVIPADALFNVAKVALGDLCILALLRNTSLVSWCSQDLGVTKVPRATQVNVSDIAVGYDVAIAILNNGSIVQWGANSTTPELENVSSVAVSQGWAAAVLQNGSLMMWPLPINSNVSQLLNGNPRLHHELHVNHISLGPQHFQFADEQYETGLLLLDNGTLVPLQFACDVGCPPNITIPPDTKSGVIGMAIGATFSLGLTTSSTSPISTGVIANAPQSATISFVLGMSATSNLTTNSTLQLQFTQQLRAAMAAYFNVSTQRVGLNVSGQQQSTALQQATLPTFRLLQAAVSQQVPVTIPVNITATWQSGDTTTPAFLQQQVSQLQQHPAAPLPAALLQTYSINASNVTISALATSHLPKAVGTTTLPSPTPSSAPSPTAQQPSSVLPSPQTPAPPPQAPQGVTSALQGDALASGVTGAAPASSKTISKGAMIGIIFGCVLGAAAVTALTVAVYRRYRAAPGTNAPMQHQGGGFEVVAIPAESVKIAGLPEGELFVLATARNYIWELSTALTGTLCAIEAGVNDTQLDKMLQPEAGALEIAAPLYCPAVQLSKDELHQQVQLLSDGLLGRGATALVFKCLWPSRFGPNALLAAKVLHNGFESDMSVLSSFAYEANLLEGIQHPHVVKLYGYCLDPPTVCLILELLPCSLKDVLYKAPSKAASSLPASNTASKSDSMTRRGTATPASSAGCVPTSSISAPTTLPMAAETTTYVSASSEVKTNHPNAAGSSGGGPQPCSPTVTADVSKYVTADSSAHPLQSEVQVAVTSPNPLSRQGAYMPPSPVRKTPSSSKVSNTTMSPAADGKSGDGTAEVKFSDSMASKSSTHLLQPITLPQIVRLCTDIAAGLAYLHSQAAPAATVNGEEHHLQLVTSRDGRIVHRDLKPANILLNSQGVAKISDFGLARQHDHTTFATINLGAGTLPYMAPELLISSKAGVSGAACTNRVDIYSLGIIMWELLMGQPPWKGMAAASIMAAVINRRRLPLPADVQSQDREHAIMDMPLLQPLPAHSHPDLPKMCQIIQACWQHRELRRPTAAALHGTLSALQQQLEQQSTQGQAQSATHNY